MRAGKQNRHHDRIFPNLCHGDIPYPPLTTSSFSPITRNVSERPAGWFGGTAVSQLSRFTISGNVSSTAPVELSVRSPFPYRSIDTTSLVVLFIRCRNSRICHSLWGQSHTALDTYQECSSVRPHLLVWFRMPRIDGIDTRKIRISLVKHALFGQDSFRFGAMLGLGFSHICLQVDYSLV